ncbi:MAG: DUF86 domain-containing protein [Planctomycetes bacterium]|nr:DUF86 domain-containing protein [Planctomycetota bacterium]MBI3844279.1 DUF86 domain-containing protein [Planctomycetota bacterium]
MAELRSYQQLPRETIVGERQVQSAVRYALQTAIQCVLDVGLHILVDEGLDQPRDNKAIIQMLGKSGVIPAEFARTIEGMAGFRNLLVHRYFKIDPERVYGHLHDHVDDFETFMKHVQDWLDRRPSSP